MSNRLERLEKACRKHKIKKFLKISFPFAGFGAVGVAVYAGIVIMASKPAEVVVSSDAVGVVSEVKRENPATGLKPAVAQEEKSGANDTVIGDIVKKDEASSSVSETPAAASAEIQTAVSPSYVLAVSSENVEKAVARISQKYTADQKQKQSKTEYPATAAEKPKTAVSLQVAPEPKAGGPKVLLSSRANLTPKENYFQEYEDESGIDGWIKKYEKDNSYSLAIYITKYYYDIGVYDKSLSWAKRANQLDRNQEDAWLFYAKSVYAMGNSAKAKRILEVYLQYRKSPTVSMLLSEWSR